VIAVMGDVARDVRELSPKEGARRYRFVTRRPVVYVLDRSTAQFLSFRDGRGREWLRVDGRRVTVAAGYAWNGCSPKRWFPLLGWVGTPDFPSTIFASLIHDCLYQFHACADFPFTRLECDDFFRRLVEIGGDADLARVYYGAVRRFGRWRDRRVNGEHSVAGLMGADEV
jgi:hypothetical protein